MSTRLQVSFSKEFCRVDTSTSKDIKIQYELLYIINTYIVDYRGIAFSNVISYEL